MNKVYMTAPDTLPPGWKEIGYTDDWWVPETLHFKSKDPILEKPIFPAGTVISGQVFMMTNALDRFDDWDGHFWLTYETPRQAVARKLGVAMRKAEASKAVRKTLRSIRRYCRLRALLTPRL